MSTEPHPPPPNTTYSMAFPSVCLSLSWQENTVQVSSKAGLVHTGSQCLSSQLWLLSATANTSGQDRRSHHKDNTASLMLGDLHVMVSVCTSLF